MFKFTSNYIVGALVAVLACASVASAAPSIELEARDTDASPRITLCVDANYGHCLTFPVVADTCRSFVGGLSGYNQVVSSVRIPVGFTCTFFRNYACISSGTDDSITLEGGGYPNFTTLPGDGNTANFNDGTSSVTCTPIV